jgi:hypothetical protein
MTAIHNPQPAAAMARRARPTVRSASGRLWALQAVLAVGYVMAAVPKLSNDPHTVAQFADLGISATGMHLIGCLELAGAVGLLIPRLCGVAALAFVGLMLGAVAVTVVQLGVVDAIVPAAFLAVAAVLAWTRREGTARLAARVVRAVR